MKNYYVRAEVMEGAPDYEFVLRAENLDHAINLAKKELKESYPDIFAGKYSDNFYCTHITGEELLKKMTIN